MSFILKCGKSLTTPLNYFIFSSEFSISFYFWPFSINIQFIFLHSFCFLFLGFRIVCISKFILCPSISIISIYCYIAIFFKYLPIDFSSLLLYFFNSFLKFSTIVFIHFFIVRNLFLVFSILGFIQAMNTLNFCSFAQQLSLQIIFETSLPEI